jgi:hydrogenase-4 membrane subunit HyfE
MNDTTTSLLQNLNALSGGLFLICTFGLVATRQVLGCLRFFVAQAFFLVVSCFLLSALLDSWHVFFVGVINIVSKMILIPWLLGKTVGEEFNTRREINQALTIPASLLIALLLVVFAYVWTQPLLHLAGNNPMIAVNLPIGLAGLLVGAYAAVVRREAVPLFLGLLSIENGVFFCGIAIVPKLSLIAELAIASDVLIVAFIVGLLTRAVHRHIGTLRVGELATLIENPKP